MTTATVNPDIAGKSPTGIDGQSLPARAKERLIHSWWTSRVIIAVAMPALVFFAFRPERYGLIPNPSDPVFYTGYAINFDDVMRELGDGRYFVTRWTHYLPSRAFSMLFGAEVGRLVLRWMVASWLLLSLLHLGRRWRWTVSTGWVVSLIVIANPLFARAFLTDYFEWFNVSFGAILVAQSLEQRSTYVRSTLIGTLAAALLIANPIAVYVVAPPVLTYGVASWWRRERPLRMSVWMVVGFTGVVVGGLLLFRSRYGIDNVYQPTIDFARSHAGIPSTHRSPRLEWMAVYLWIYSPILIASICVLIVPVRELFRRSRAAQIALGFLLVQFGFQSFDQFVRKGLSLEVSFYWSAIAPAMLVCLGVILGAVDWSAPAAALFTGCWAGALAFPYWSDVTLPRVWWYLPIATLVMIGCAFLSRRHGTSAIALSVLFLLLSFVATPRYDPFSYHRFNDSPQYASVFFVPDGSKGDLDLAEIVWLERELDRLPDDSDLYFMPSPQAISVTGIYVPHVTGHLFKYGLDGNAQQKIDLGSVPRLAVFGEEDFVSSTVEQLADSARQSTTMINTVVPGVRHRRLVVLEFDSRYFWPASVMPSRTGEVVGTKRVATPGVDEREWLVHGPRIALEEAKYRASVVYETGSDVPTDEVVGFFDVAMDNQRAGKQEMLATAPGGGEASIDFEGTSGGSWEFRVRWHGYHPISVASVRLEVVQ